jgi:hypothetical protein
MPGVRSVIVAVVATAAVGGAGLAITSNGPSCATSTSNVADGRDPWGGCFPGPSNTGVPAGTSLTTYTGSCIVTTPNLVIDSKIINCPAEDADSSGACRDTSVCMWIEAANVTIRNSQINGAVWIDDPSQNYSFTVTDSTFDVGLVNTSTSLENNASRGIGKSHFTATRVNVFKGGAGIWCEYDCSVTDSYIHDQDTDEGGHDHQSGIRQGSGGTGSGYAGQTFTHNTVLCNAPDVAPDAGCSADFTGYGDFAFIQYNTVQKNLLLSTTGGTCAYGGNSTGRPFVNGSHNVWQDNVFQRGPSGRGTTDGFGHCGYWFGMADWDGAQTGNVFTGNVWDDGTTVVPNT